MFPGRGVSAALRAPLGGGRLRWQRCGALAKRPAVRRAFATAAAEAPVAAQAGQQKKQGWGRRLAQGVGAVGIAGAGGVLYCKLENEKAIAKATAARKAVIEERIPTREEMLARLRSEEFDLLVVGGGATGAGLALDAATRGLNVACVELEDFASGTSSKSTKLLWAGSRYLVRGMVGLFSPSTLMNPVQGVNDFLGTFNMVMGCFRERSYMLQVNPHLTNWVPVAVPIPQWIIWPPPFNYPPAALGPATGLYGAFFKFYDFLGNFAAPGSHFLFPRKLDEKFPQLNTPNIKYANVFYEGAHNDARTNLAIACTAMVKGAAVLNYMPVSKILFDENGHARGAECVDLMAADAPASSSAGNNQKNVTVRAKKVIYCAGPFTDDVRELSEGAKAKVKEPFQKVVTGAGGTHIVLPHYYCPRDMGMCDMQTSRGSFLFYLPWQGHTLVGTTDVKVSHPELHSAVPEDDVNYLVRECSKYLAPEMKVRREDVLSAWYGVRPLCVDPNAADSKDTSRDHVVSYNAKNDITFVSGGKWTTWREMAEDALDKSLEVGVAAAQELKAKAGNCLTHETPLLGAGRNGEFAPEGYKHNLDSVLSRKYHINPEVATHLVKTYGTRASDVLDFEDGKRVKRSPDGAYQEFPKLTTATNCHYLECEVRYAVQNEHACTAADILMRRTRLAFLNSTAAHAAVDRVIEIMGEMKGWSSSRKAQETKKCRDMLHREFLGPVPRKD
mmetsp:Transcript_69/g.128  ORF Transcript_69/g.128 Transcript_69/m.128 type:complete len:729 (+) Transcript_69:167-2353(+)|eukprot:CAMPEP_0178991972 /NCGR_PEP_ID=MMETSP0795-20121207/5840_1 /TAXON_ID=88552 /ORGANISM="Amoebophrya sp., Strain Ameob2" /LENGTH=728 /DNA_ID=CAMNT_0020683771 /DNA_START=116 /DNA_END=2302 /DNA_ORIENTATION=+